MIFVLFSILAGFVLINGCSSVTPAEPLDKKPVAGIEKSDNGSAVFAPDPQETSDLERLARLAQKRRQEGLGGDFPIGPGDVLQVSVTGMTDRALREEIRRRLQTNYMHDPHVVLFVKEFRSRQVAVVGAVSRPGLYSLASGADTIFDMISLAGGMNAGAAERIVLIPADPAEPEKAKAIVASLPAQVISEDPSPLIMKSVDPIVINLNILKRGGNERYLGLLARPGDVIMIPGAGDVLLQGWIEKPGSYKITPGLTLLGVVAAAGGPTFPADRGAVKIIRTNKLGEKTFFVANLDSIERGEERDLALQEGDVIDLSYSSPKLVAYGFYRFFSQIFRIGVGATARIPINE
jgi:protein involved in polysaccharide export with SLBB domain